jgi:nitrite reductase/ring-hydroxylating ferredoxin subunit
MSGSDTGRTGAALRPGPSVESVLRADGDAVPACLFEQSAYPAPPRPVAKARYTSREWLDREVERMWSRVWQMACREEEIAEPGDFIVYDIVDTSVLVVRTESGAIAAYYNSCLHRGTQLAPSGSAGTVGEFRCPYHGWRYALDGRVRELPCDWDFPQLDARSLALPAVRVGTWGGFVFVNLDPHCGPLEDYLGVLPEHFRAWSLEKRRIGAHVAKVIPCNWKAGIEAFLEGYHVAEVHPQALAFTGDVNGQLDVWGAHVSRMIANLAQPSPRIGRAVSEQQVMEALGAFVPGDVGSLAANGLAPRQAMAAALGGMLSTATGVDHSGHSISEIIDAINYFVFPNLMPWAGFGTPIVYRVRPHGRDPDRSVLEVYLLYVVPDGAAPDPPPPVRWLGEDEPWSNAQELGGLGPIFDQDGANFALIQRGMKAGGDPHLRPAAYQESRIRHLHDTLARYVGDG